MGGGEHSCAHLDVNGDLVQETVVIGGEDCNDNPLNNGSVTYVGAAINTLKFVRKMSISTEIVTVIFRVLLV